jgi:hypothetical protein
VGLTISLSAPAHHSRDLSFQTVQTVMLNEIQHHQARTTCAFVCGGHERVCNCTSTLMTSDFFRAEVGIYKYKLVGGLGV